MIRVDTLEKALTGQDMGGIEAAFRALVAFPHGERIDGARNVDHLCKLLERITRALHHDQTVLPSETIAVIAAAVKSSLSDAASYAEGAAVVSEHQYHWRGVYLQHVLKTGTV